MGNKKSNSMMVMMLIPIAVAINIVGGQMIAMLKLPIYLDAIGTLLISILGGIGPGIIVGFLSNSINAIFQPDFFPFVLVSVAIAVVTGLLSKAGMFRTIPKTIISALFIALSAVVTGAPIAAYVFGGVTGSGTTVLLGALRAGGHSLLSASVITSLFTDTIDKGLSVAVCFIIIKTLAPRILVKLPLGKQFVKLDALDNDDDEEEETQNAEA